MQGTWAVCMYLVVQGTCTCSAGLYMYSTVRTWYCRVHVLVPYVPGSAGLYMYCTYLVLQCTCTVYYMYYVPGNTGYLHELYVPVNAGYKLCTYLVVQGACTVCT